jgi:hypothetical protein
MGPQVGEERGVLVGRETVRVGEPEAELAIVAADRLPVSRLDPVDQRILGAGVVAVRGVRRDRHVDLVGDRHRHDPRVGPERVHDVAHVANPGGDVPCLVRAGVIADLEFDLETGARVPRRHPLEAIDAGLTV